MDSLFVNGKFCGLVMAAGSAVLLLMLADLLYKGIIIAANAFDATIRRRERRNVTLLMDSANSPLISGGSRGSSIPLLITLTISGIVLYFHPGGMHSILFSEVIWMWGIAGACVANVRCSCSCSVHASLFVRKFYSAFASFQDRRKALDDACAALPEGEVRVSALNAGDRLAGGAEWKEAVKAVDNGMFCGKGLAVFLTLYDSSSANPDEPAVSAFTGAFAGIADGIKARIGILHRTGLILCICMTVYTGTFAVLSNLALSAQAAAAILITGLFLSSAVILFRNVLVYGRLI